MKKSWYPHAGLGPADAGPLTRDSAEQGVNGWIAGVDRTRRHIAIACDILCHKRVSLAKADCPGTLE